MSRVAVIGGGPAGIMAASMAAQNGHSVRLFEKNEKKTKQHILSSLFSLFLLLLFEHCTISI